MNLGWAFSSTTRRDNNFPMNTILKWNGALKTPPVTNGEAKKIGYNLPVRTVFGKLHNGEMAQKIVDELNIR
ncbi:hypothetical protein [Sporosarcina sp. SG10008]|uniref:hypothetical protein n=1 Tax=Sporosarcina sp. SG10008 TaxID=3373103 RepID=UPI0037DD6E32